MVLKLHWMMLMNVAIGLILQARDIVVARAEILLRIRSDALVQLHQDLLLYAVETETLGGMPDLLSLFPRRNLDMLTEIETGMYSRLQKTVIPTVTGLLHLSISKARDPDLINVRDSKKLTKEKCALNVNSRIPGSRLIADVVLGRTENKTCVNRKPIAPIIVR